MDPRVVGITFEELTENEMAYISGGDGSIEPMSTPSAASTASYVLSAISGALSSGVVSYIASAWAKCG